LRNPAIGTPADIDAVTAGGGSQDCGIEQDPHQQT
jgi:hypothetical protein